MKLRWEDEAAPWEPPTDMTAPGALFNARPVRKNWYEISNYIGFLYTSSLISKGTARKLLINTSGV